jgi:hypothetical protein
MHSLYKICACIFIDVNCVCCKYRPTLTITNWFSWSTGNNSEFLYLLTRVNGVRLFETKSLEIWKENFDPFLD